MKSIILTLFFFFIFSNSQESQNFYSVPALSTPSTVFNEIFDDAWEERWVVTKHRDYEGKWKVAPGAEPYGVKEDKGLIVDSEARKHGIISKFEKTLDNTDKDLIIQYELRLQQELDCGGAYIKLLTKKFFPKNLQTFSNDVPYTIMFGPDKCGSSNKIHFIIRHQNPIDNIYSEKHLKNTPTFKTDSMTHLYRLKIERNNNFAIYVDGEKVTEGNLLEDFEPSINPPSEIDDPSDKKPKGWVDEALIPDPTATKPLDWDESAPATVVDEEDVKPLDWLDDEPLNIPDPGSHKPIDWDDELDGQWEAPMIPNPKCNDLGCGEWKPRTIPNPNYKGKWTPPLIDNPKYIGEWKPRQIPNPKFFIDEHPHNLEPIEGIGIEIWTMKSGIMFDNILITHSEEEADSWTSKTWEKKHVHEQSIYDEEIAKKTPSLSQQISEFWKIIYDYVSDPQNLLVVIGTLIVALLVPILFCFLIPSAPKEKKVKKEKKEKSEKDEEEEKEKNEEEDENEKNKKKEEESNEKKEKKEKKENTETKRRKKL